MIDEPKPVSLHDRIVEQVLRALDDGTEPDVAALASRVSATEDQVRTVVASVLAYRELLASERSRRGTARVTDEVLAAGTRIGDFVVEAVLGSGAMAVVYRARQLSLGGRVVALKVLPPSLVARDQRFADRFRREAELASRVHHPNLAEVYGYQATPEAVCFAMRLIEGRTLHDVLAGLAVRHSGPVRATSPEHVRRCVSLVRDLADALATIHVGGLVHRDVKPSNVLMEKAGQHDVQALAARPVLVDFGLLRPTGDSELTGTHTLLGTPAYAAHESVLGGDLDGRADVFSLAVVLHDLVTSTSPCARERATAGLPEARSINPAVDLRLAAILSMALQEKRELRYSHGGSFRDDLDRYLRGEPIRALPMSRLGRVRLWARRDPARAARAAVAAMLVVAVSVVLGAIGTWAWGVTALASVAARAERAGDLLGAAKALRMLADDKKAGLLPWLRDDLLRVAGYWDEDGPLHEVTQHLLKGDAALLTGDDSDRAAEQEYAIAHDRACDLLFSEHEPRFGDAVRRFLIRELREGDPEFRQHLAMDTWTNYLIVQEGRQILVPELEVLLRDRLFGSTPLPNSTTRHSAVAAFGAIRSEAVFRDLIPLLADDDPEVARLAYCCSYHVYRWLLFLDAAACDALDARLLTAWGEATMAYGKRNGEPRLLDAVANHLAWWERNPERGEPEARRLPLSEDVRSVVDEVGRDLAATHASLRDPAPSESLVTDSARGNYLVASGRGFDRYEAAIWQEHSAPEANGSLGDRTREQVPTDVCFGRLEFLSEPDGTIRPWLSGTIVSVDRSQAELRDWEGRDNNVEYLCLVRPGRSQLRIVTLVPPGAVELEIRLCHMLAGRPVLPRSGRVRYRLYIDGLDWGLESMAPGCSTPNDKGIETFTVSTHRLVGRHGLKICLEYAQGNTTYRVEAVDLAWRFASGR